jgi:hypothetical protein
MTVGMVCWREKEGMMMTTDLFFKMERGGEGVVLWWPGMDVMV